MPKSKFHLSPKLFLALSSFLFLNSLNSCTFKREEGTKDNPIQVSMVPSKDARALLLSGEDFAKWMENETGYEFEVSIPTSYVAVVEAIGSKRVDIAFLNTTTYFMAQDKYGAEAKFITLGADGSSQYKGQFIVRTDSKIQKLEDIHGKKMAYVDPTSASGYILPAYQLKSKNIRPSETVFAGKHDSVVTMVYQKQVDAGATFYTAPENGQPMDARRLIAPQYPDVWGKIKILDFTTMLVNDAVVFRQDLPLEMKEKIQNAMEKWSQTAEGKVTLKALNNGSGFRRASGADYLEARKILTEMGQSLNQ